MSQSDMYTIADDLIGLVGEFPLQNIDAESFGKEHGVSADHVVKIGHWCKQNGYMTESSHSDMQHAIWCGMLTAEGEEVAAGRATTHPDKTPTQASTTNFNFNGSVTAGMIGSNNTQTSPLRFPKRRFSHLPKRSAATATTRKPTRYSTRRTMVRTRTSSSMRLHQSARH